MFYVRPPSLVSQNQSFNVNIIQQYDRCLAFCNSMPFGAAWAYYGKVLVLASVASWNSRVRG